MKKSPPRRTKEPKPLSLTYYAHADTPAGAVLFVGDGTKVSGIHWKSYKYSPKVGKGWVQNKKKFASLEKQLKEYFKGKRKKFDVDVAVGGTDFQKRVWKEIRKIPYGSYVSYADIARAVGRPGAVRAVGTAVGRNPLPIVVPCHRVLPTSGKLGNYSGGIDKKKMLLVREGVSWR